MKLTLRAAQKIRKKPLFSAITRRGRLLRGRVLRLWILNAEEGAAAPCRLGVIVSRKTHARAAKRNLWKRRIREAFRRNQKKIFPGKQIVVQSGLIKEVPEFREIEEDMLRLLKKAEALCDQD